MNINEREIVLDMLVEVEKGSFSHVVLSDTLDRYGYLDKQIRSFITRVFLGTIEYRYRIDMIVDSFSKTPIRKMKPIIRNVIRMSVYQILFMDNVPSHAVCNEAVKLVTKRGLAGLKGFVNGVLRNIDRSKNEIVAPDRNISEEEYLAWTYSMPLWIVKMWHKEYDSETLEAILSGLLEKRPVYIRISAKADLDNCVQQIKDAGISITQSKLYERAFVIDNFDRISEVPGFEEGKVYIQDISSQLAVLACGADKGNKVVDVCAAPGGKSMFLSELVGDDGHVISRDLTEYKVSMIEDNAERLGIKNLSAECFDATVFDEKLSESMDIVFADLPCSGLGVIGRKPDIKYRVTYEDIKSLASLQSDILDVVCRYVKPGGTLLFSTCTITKAENDGNVAAFLKRHPEFRVKPIFEDGLKNGFSDELLCSEGSVQLLPKGEASDGFFIAGFTKIK